MDSLPQESISEILSHLPQGDRKSFRNSSLIAKSWVTASQIRLFESVAIPFGKLESRLEYISQMKGELLKHIRHLDCKEDDLTRLRRGDGPLRKSFGSLIQLRRLDLHRTTIALSPGDINLFSAFHYTLSYIRLSHCEISKDMFVAVVKYFPKLECFDFLNLRLNDFHDRAPLTPQPLMSRKKLIIVEQYIEFMYIPDQLSKLGLRFDEISLPYHSQPEPWMKFANEISRVFRDSVKCLRLPEIPSSVFPYSMSNLPYSYHGNPCS